MSVPDAEIAIDESRAARWIGAAFEDLRGRTVQSMGHGFDNAAFLVDETWVFRLPRRAAAVPFLRRELEVLPAFALDAPLATSAPERVCADGALDYPYPFAGYRKLDGTPATQTRAHPDVPRQLGSWLRWLHDREHPHPGAPCAQGLGKQNPEVALTHIRERVGRVDIDAEPVLRLADALVGAPIATERRWVHGDMYPRHLLLDDDGRLTGVIDWGDLHRGEVALDLSVAFGWLTPTTRAAFFEEYGPIHEDIAERARFLALWYGVVLAELGAREGFEDLRPVGLRYLTHVLGEKSERS